jgi:hypothetical protein
MTQAIIIILAGAFLLLLVFAIYLNYYKGSFVEYVQLEPKTYRLSTLIYFYKGLPPTINESAFHSPQIPIQPCMILKQISLQGEYIVFEVKANECKGAEQRLNGCMVYYKKDLFNRLPKHETT